MRGPRRLQLGPKIVSHDAVHRRIAELYALLLGEPLLDFFVAAKPFRLSEPVFQCLHHFRWDRLLAGLGPWILDLLDFLDASFFVEGQPIGNRVAMDA